jgi:hypothetical protein
MTQLLGFGSEKRDDAVDALVYLILGLVGDGIEEQKVHYSSINNPLCLLPPADDFLSVDCVCNITNLALRRVRTKLVQSF